MRSRLRAATVWVLAVAAMLAVGALAQTPGGLPTTDPAYAVGYNAGYPLGQKDQDAGAPANPHKFRIYQNAEVGYTDSYGTRAAYRRGFQSGFDDGYGDGYAGHPRSISAPIGAADASSAPLAPAAPQAPAAPPAPTAPDAAPDAVKTPRANGYREGYNVGQSDANSNAAYNATASAAYKQATLGYSRDLGAPDQYQLNFRSGFDRGYDDGYNHRLYNTAIGGRQLPELAPTGGANDLPTDPERLRARPSGIYDNGLLIAEGTRLHGTLDRGLDTKTAHVGDAFSVTVTVPVWVGAVAAIPAGSTIQGTVEQVTRGGTFSGHGELQLQYNTLTLPGQAPLPLNANTVGVGAAAQSVNQNEGTVNGQNSDVGRRAATGAAMGGILGGVFGGAGGLIRGGIAGAAVGTAGSVISRKKDLVLRQGEPFLIRLERPLELPKKSGE